MPIPGYNGDIQSLFSRPCCFCPCKVLEMSTPITECLACGHEQDQHKSLQELLPGILEKMVLLGKTNKEILRYLEPHGIEWSMRTLKRRLFTYDIQRSRHLEPDTLINIVELALQQAKKRAGYRRIYKLVRQEYNIPVRRDDVEMVVKALDPEGPRERLQRKCRRRVFHCPGPDNLWSIDGHDKLASFGIFIHGCLDAFSRKVLWCHTYTNNHNPRIIAKHYMDTIQRLQVVPTRVRFDPGTENTVTAELQMYLRRDDDDEHARKKSIIIYKSKFNQKIECFWSGLYDKVTSLLHDEFTAMAQRGLIDDPQNREAFLYIYLPLVKTDVDQYISWWNNHRIRKQKGVSLPTGASPDDMYYMPDLFGADRYGYQYSTEDLEVAADYHDIPVQLPDIVSNEFRTQADRFTVDNGLVVTKDSAERIFQALCNMD